MGKKKPNCDRTDAALTESQAATGRKFGRFKGHPSEARNCVPGIENRMAAEAAEADGVVGVVGTDGGTEPARMLIKYV